MLIFQKFRFYENRLILGNLKYHLVFSLVLNLMLNIKSQDGSKSNYHPNSENEFEYISCGKSKCIVSQGYCQESKNDINQIVRSCVCFEEYSTISNPFNYECNYIKRSQLKAFLLELILSNGVGHFYLGNYYLAIPKLIIWVFSYYFFIFLRITCKAAEENKRINFFIASLSLFFCIGMLTWQIIDVVLFALNKYKDSYGIDLLSW